MKIALVGLGRMPIPAKDLRSVENIIWNYKLNLEKLGHTVDIFNTPWIYEVIHELNTSNYDFIHLHSDLHALPFAKHLKKPFCVTSHCGGFSDFIPGKFDYYPEFNYIYEDTLLAPGNIVLSDHIKELYKKSSYKGFLRVLRNPVETSKFAFKPRGNGKAVCIGRIQNRKQQAILANLLENKVEIDFIGPYDPNWEKNSIPFKENATCKWLGNWDKETLYKNLSNYSCLLQFSKSEASPLVVLEAMAAGLSVVVNKSSSANLTNEPFITILDNTLDADKISHAVHEAITNNEKYRTEIKDYVFNRFDYSNVVKEYLAIIEAFKANTK